MYIRPKDRSGYHYYQIVFGELDKKVMTLWMDNGHGCTPQFKEAILNMPTTITLPREIFLPKNSSVFGQCNVAEGTVICSSWSSAERLPSGAEQGDIDEMSGKRKRTITDCHRVLHVVRPDHPDYLRAVAAAAVDHCNCVVQQTRPIHDRLRFTTRHYREHLRHEKAEKKLYQMYVFQRLADVYWTAHITGQSLSQRVRETQER